MGHDALDAHRRHAQQLRELLLGALRREVGKQVADDWHSTSLLGHRVVTRTVAIGQAGRGCQSGGKRHGERNACPRGKTSRQTHPVRRREARRVLDDAGIDVILATSKHNVQYLLGGYRFFFFDYMDAIGVSRYLPVLIYRRGKPDEAAYIGYRLEAFENELGKFWTPSVKTASSGSVDAVKLAAEHIRGLGRGIRRIGIEAAFLPADADAALRQSLPECEIVDAHFPLERLRAQKTPAELRLLREASERAARCAKDRATEDLAGALEGAARDFYEKGSNERAGVLSTSPTG